MAPVSDSVTGVQRHKFDEAFTVTCPSDPDLRLAMDCSYPGLSKPNTVWMIRMHTSKGKYEIAKEAFARKKDLFLHPPVGLIGCRGFEKFIKELPHWKSELSVKITTSNFIRWYSFSAQFPQYPMLSGGIEEPDSIAFGGGFDKAAVVLESLGTEYRDEAMLEAAEIFRRAVPVIGQIKENIVDYLTGKNDETEQLPLLFSQVADIMKAGFETLPL